MTICNMEKLARMLHLSALWSTSHHSDHLHMSHSNMNRSMTLQYWHHRLCWNYLAVQGDADDFSQFPEVTPRSVVPMTPWLSLLVHLMLFDLFGQDHPARTASRVKLQWAADAVASLPAETHTMLANSSPHLSQYSVWTAAVPFTTFCPLQSIKQTPRTTQPPIPGNNAFFPHQ